jgi:2-polyprenyl-3-methyl-5-hydroxy-6-metoxy-1,4-benzoquinol methylase
MIDSAFGRIYDNRRSDSWSNELRKKRVSLLQSLIKSLPKPIKILDVGGLPPFWEVAGFSAYNTQDLDITLINLELEQIEHPKFKRIVGDARNMPQFQDREFDVVFSNSVIEHAGDYEDQARMAKEIRRVGKRYFIQTPNLYFPIEPHFLFPFFQFLPLNYRVWLLTHFDLGWYSKMDNWDEAKELLASTNLLSRKQLQAIFPGGTIHDEKVFGFNKAFIVYDGW